MNEFLNFLVQYGYILLFFWVLLDQAGLPLPSVPVLLAAGALTGSHQLNFWWVICVAVVASVPIDYIWYYLGRTRGGKVLNLICSISFEPDYCVRDTEAYFARFGQFSLLIAKFVPGLQTLAPPMSGFIKMSAARFFLLDTMGAIIWAGSIVWLGAMFHNQLEEVAVKFAELGGWAVTLLLAILALYVVVKFTQRQLFLRSLRMRRMEPAEVHDRLRSESGIHIIDLRHSMDVSATPYTLPTASLIPMEYIDEHVEKIPKDRDIVLYCS